MQVDFSRLIDRTNTASTKWDETENLFGEKGLLPMWVADMDFPSPEPVIKAIKRRAEHGIFGYTVRTDSYYESITGWLQRRHQWTVQKDWICHTPGIVPALNFIVQAYTKPGDKVLIQSPVYYPFEKAIVNNNRIVINNELKLSNGRYFMDMEDLKAKIELGVKMVILCSPHNPVGRVWTKEELIEFGTICLENNVIVVSDEIHFDLLYKGQKHTCFASISEEFAANSITCIAPSKTFNLAGLQTSSVIIPNPELRDKFMQLMNTHSLRNTNTFGVVATESAYREGEAWLEQLLDYLQGNLEFLTDFIEKRIPKIKVIQPEGTYLVWLDCRALGLDDKQLEQLMLKQAKVALRSGYLFGKGGEGFARMNIACPRSLLEEGLKRIERAVNALVLR